MPRIRLTKFGKIDESLLGQILKIMKESYLHLGDPMGGEVDLYVFEKSSTMHVLLTDEEDNLGIKTSSIGEAFPITHDAWSGKPRIRISLDRFLEYPKEVGMGGIRHAAGHSILHGSVVFYKMPRASTMILEKYSFSEDYANALFYLISLAVKSYEVSRFLYSKYFTEDQVAYAKYFLKPGDEDILAWKIGSQNPLGRILCSVSIKEIAYAVPLVNDKKVGDETREFIEKKIAHFSAYYKLKIRKIVYETFPLLGKNTVENINFITSIIAKEIIDYELK